MKLWVGDDPQAVAVKAADAIEEMIKQKPNCVLGLATGSTPLPTYQELINRHRDGRIDFSQVRTFNLDEYYGLKPDHAQRYAYFLEENLFRRICLPRRYQIICFSCR